MAFNREDTLRLKAEFAQRHRDRIDEATQRRKELYRVLPDLLQIDRALSETAGRVYAEIARGPEGIQERVEAIRQENTELQKARAACLEFHGYPANYTDPKFDCPVCQDLGTVGLTMCACLRKALVLAGYESAGIGELMKTQTFESFDLSYYARDAKAQENMRTVYLACRDYAMNFRTGVSSGPRHLLLRGGTGLGKTHLSTAIAKTVIEQAYDVVYDTAQNIFSAFEGEHFAANTERGAQSAQRAARAMDCDLLILDDLGAEFLTQFTVSTLYNLINTRINANRAMIVNTNLTWEELRKRYSDRIASRLFGEFRPLVFSGGDVRAAKLERGL